MCVYLAIGVSSDLPPPEHRTLMPPIPVAYCARWHIDANGDTVSHTLLAGNDPALPCATETLEGTTFGGLSAVQNAVVEFGTGNRN